MGSRTTLPWSSRTPKDITGSRCPRRPSQLYLGEVAAAGLVVDVGLARASATGAVDHGPRATRPGVDLSRSKASSVLRSRPGADPPYDRGFGGPPGPSTVTPSPSTRDHAAGAGHQDGCRLWSSRTFNWGSPSSHWKVVVAEETSTWEPSSGSSVTTGWSRRCSRRRRASSRPGPRAARRRRRPGQGRGPGRRVRAAAGGERTMKLDVAGDFSLGVGRTDLRAPQADSGRLTASSRARPARFRRRGFDMWMASSVSVAFVGWATSTWPS